MITINVLLAQTEDRAWYAIGGASLIVDEHEGLNFAYRVGVGVEINDRFGVELLWDSAPSLEPRRLIQKADLPRTIAPLETDIQSHLNHYLTTVGTVKFDLFKNISFLGKVGVAQHSQKIEFDALSSGKTFIEGFKVEDRSTVPVISIGAEILTNRFRGMSFQYTATRFFEGNNNAILMTAAMKFSF